MRAATTQVTRQGRADVLFAWLGIAPEQRLGAHDHARNAKAALRGLLVDECLLERAGILDRPESFNCSDFLIANLRYRSDAGADRLIAEEHGA